jgi:ABC-type methionine transport system ATPase subunit
VVLVEHNMQVVMNVCELIHVMDRGETIAHGVARGGCRTTPRCSRPTSAKGDDADHGARATARRSAREVLLSVKTCAVAYGGIKP